MVIPGILNYLANAFLSGGRVLGSVIEVRYLLIVNEESPGWVREGVREKGRRRKGIFTQIST